MTAAEDDADPAAAEPRAPWADDLDLPERVIVVPTPAGALHPDVVAGDDGEAWEGPPTEAMPSLAGPSDQTWARPSTEAEPPLAAVDADPDEPLGGPPTEAVPTLAAAGAAPELDVTDDEPGVDPAADAVPPLATAGPAPELDVVDEPWEGPPTEAIAVAAGHAAPELDVTDDIWAGPPTEAVALHPDATDEPWEGPPEADADEPWDGAAAAAAAFAAERGETGPGALRPSAPKPVSVKRGPSRSRRAVSRLRALIGLLLLVFLSGVALAAAIGVAVLLVAFVLKRAFGS